jgi:serine/threonine-protein kinase
LADDEGFRHRFLREARYAASLDHPNIVPIHEAGESAGVLYLAMRLVRRGTLAALLRRAGPLRPDHAMAILGPVADDHDAAHAADLVHRDVKPGNILLTPAGGRDWYKYRAGCP